MMTWLSFGLLVMLGIAITEARSLAKAPVSIVLGPNAREMLMMRSKRHPVPYPQRALMISGYYRPTRSDPLTGVFAQEPADDVTSAAAEAAPDGGDGNEENYSDDRTDEQPQDDIQPYGTDAPGSDKSITGENNPAKRPVKANKATKKNKKTTADESEEEVEEESDEEELYDKKRGRLPNFNNFFPMVFRFPNSYGHRGSESEGSPPGMITAIANSYSTGKGGIASSIATAYGGTPNGKKKRVKTTEE
ncbi:uncharacterized protein [Fopius arisanus]|uniref:Uncharacterized protein isoform X2 n=1 Tax=Fopius arisanus TaxID=64838 RepID=A0A9R1U1T5_9HYME|nr:PREDICTED: uncharacterized protein LOC105267099 isoform X2 [Fopius arisanus]